MKNKAPKANHPGLAQVVRLFPERSVETAEARKAERRKRALVRGGISRWTYSDPNHDYAIMSDIRDCISELKDEALSETMREAWLEVAGRTLSGGAS